MPRILSKSINRLLALGLGLTATALLAGATDITLTSITYVPGPNVTVSATGAIDTGTGTTVVVSAGSNVTFNATYAVTLKPGFHAEAGAFFHASVDADGDGIPDGWELAHGLNPSDPADAGAASAGTPTLTNRDCYLLGIEPGTTVSEGGLSLKVHRPN